MLGYPIPRWFIIVGLVALGALGLAGLSLRQKTVTVDDAGQILTLHTQAASVGEALQSAGLVLYPEDIVQPAVNSPLDHGMAIRLDRATPVEITEAGVRFVIRTHQQKIGAIIAEAGKTVAPGDSVYVDGRRIPSELFDTPGPVPHALLIQRAMAVTILDGDSSHTLTTSALTPGDAIAEANIPLYVADGVTPPLAS